MVTKLRRLLDAAASTGGSILVASDLDGTLTETTGAAEPAELAPHTRVVLTALAQSPRVHLAVLTGRSVADASRRLRGIGPLWLAAEHGAFLVDPLLRVHPARESATEEQVATLGARAAEIAQRFAGARVEVKGLGVALHHGDVASDRHDELARLFRLACAAQRARVVPGRGVIEGRLVWSERGFGLARVLAELPRDLPFVYAGDDHADPSALSLASAAKHGVGLYVRSRERPSPPRPVTGVLGGPAEWQRVLEAVVAALGDARATHGTRVTALRSGVAAKVDGRGSA